MIVKIDPKDGTVLQRFTPASDYSESVAWWGKTLWSVSFSDNGIYAGVLKGDQIPFKRRGSTPEAHAWGVTHDDRHLILTGNYSANLYFMDPKTLKVVKKITSPVKDLEDLAWDGKGIWASSFSSYRGQVFRIDPNTGRIDEFFSLPDPSDCPVIDGIAYAPEGLWITGKHCPSIYLVKKPSEREITSK